MLSNICDVMILILQVLTKWWTGFNATKLKLFAENLSEQLHSMARRVFCVGTLNFWKAFERLPLVGFERLRGSQWGRRRILESRRHNCHLSLRIKHCSMPVTVGQWPVKFFPTIERRFTSRPVGRSQWIRGLSHLIGQDGCSWIPWVGGFIGCPFHFYPFSIRRKPNIVVSWQIRFTHFQTYFIIRAGVNRLQFNDFNFVSKQWMMVNLSSLYQNVTHTM